MYSYRVSMSIGYFVGYGLGKALVHYPKSRIATIIDIPSLQKEMQLIKASFQRLYLVREEQDWR